MAVRQSASAHTTRLTTPGPALAAARIFKAGESSTRHLRGPRSTLSARITVAAHHASPWLLKLASASSWARMAGRDGGRRPGRGGRGEGPRGGPGRGKGGRINPGTRPVSESDRISIADQLEAFQRSDATGVHAAEACGGPSQGVAQQPLLAGLHPSCPDIRPGEALVPVAGGTANPCSSNPSPPAAEYTFPPGLSNHDRAVVHAECKKYGFRSKSSGWVGLAGRRGVERTACMHACMRAWIGGKGRLVPTAGPRECCG